MIVADTSALISLATADTIDVVLDEFEVHTTETVVEELRATADYDDASAEGADSVLSQKERLTIHSVDASELDSSRIDEGEESCALLARQEDAAFLITDDLRALPELRPLITAEVAISPIVLKALVKRDVYTLARARTELEQIAANRDWLEAPIYRRAEALFEE